MKIQKIIMSLLCTMILYSCTNLGSKTFFKSDRIEHFGTLGFCPLQDDSILTKVFANTNEIFEETIQKSLQNYGILTVHCFDQKVNFNNPDTKLIRTICYEKSIETLLLSKLQFIHVIYSVYSVPVAENYDTEVELKLFSKNGDLLSHTLHNTYKGNSYMMSPSADITVRDGTIGAINRMAKDMGLKENN